MVRETDSAALPGFWWSVMWGTTAHPPSNYTTLTQRGNHVSPSQGHFPDVWLHRCPRGKARESVHIFCVIGLNIKNDECFGVTYSGLLYWLSLVKMAWKAMTFFMYSKCINGNEKENTITC